MCVYARVCIRMCASVCVHKYVSVHTCMGICVCVRVCECASLWYINTRMLRWWEIYVVTNPLYAGGQLAVF